jgi:hypothetical protein
LYAIIQLAIISYRLAGVMASTLFASPASLFKGGT